MLINAPTERLPIRCRSKWHTAKIKSGFARLMACRMPSDQPPPRRTVMAGFFMRGRMGGMIASSETPGGQPSRTMYICPGCKTPMPFGTETETPPDNCPKCNRRLYIPTVIGPVLLGRTRDKPEHNSPQHTVSSIRFRKLRIAFSATCLIACVLFIALWVRSYWWNDYAFKPIDFRLAVSLSSYTGQTSIRVATFTSNTNFPQGDGTMIPVRASGWQFGAQVATRRVDQLRFNFRRLPYLTIEAPHWFWVLISAMLCFIGAAPWIRSPKRFSLRTLLIATTLVAVLLGLAAWAARRTTPP